MYHLVEFSSEKDENGCPVAVVPDNWLDGKTCKWPPSGKLAWAKNKKDPEDSWKSYPVRVLYSNELYSKVRAKEEEAFEQSDIASTDVETRQQLKRKPIQNRKYLYSSEEEDDIVAAQDRAPKRFAGVAGLSTLPKPPRTQILETSEDETASPMTSRCSTPASLLLTSTPKPLLSRSFSACGNERTEQDALMALRGEIRSHFKTTYTILENMKADIADNGKKIDMLLAMQSVRPTALPSLPEDFEFPISTEEEMGRLDIYLRDDSAKANLTQYAATIGGKDTKDKTKRILRRLMANQLAMTYNLTGVKGKKSFNALKLKSVVTDAIKSHDSLVTEKAIDGTIVNWLTCARDRDGGRAKRTSVSGAQLDI